MAGRGTARSANRLIAPSRAIRAIMLKGATLGDLLHEIMALTILALIFAGLALARFRRTLD